MNTVSKAAIVSVFSLMAFYAQAGEHHHGDMPTAGQSQVVSASGVVKAIDNDSHKITIAHEPVPALNWPAMTMRFTLTPQTRLTAISPGDKVAFTFIQQGNLSLLQTIQRQ